MAIVQPVIWLGLFGKAFNLTGILNIPPEVLSQLPPDATASLAKVFNTMLASVFGGTTDYFSYMAAGMLSIIVLFTSMFSGMGIAWDRRLGFLNKLLVAPIPRGAIIISRVFSSVIRGVFQAAIVFVIAIAFGLKVGNAFSILDLGTLFAALFLLSTGLSSLFISITVRLKSWESQMAVMNLLNLPLMFASNALFPIKQMPGWLQIIARFNPISYATDAVRQSILHNVGSLDVSTLIFDFIVLLGFSAIFTSSGILLAERSLRKG